MYNARGERISTRGFFCTGMQPTLTPVRVPYTLYKEYWSHHRVNFDTYRKEDKTVEVLFKDDEVDEARQLTQRYDDYEWEIEMKQHSNELVRIPYRIFKNLFPHVATMKGSYDPETKTVEIIVNSYTEPALYEQAKRYEWDEEKGNQGSVEAYRQDCLVRSLSEVGIVFHPLK